MTYPLTTVLKMPRANNHALRCQTNSEILTNVFLKCVQRFVTSAVVLILTFFFGMMTWKGCEMKRLWTDRILSRNLHTGTQENEENTDVNMVLRSRFEPNTLQIKP